MNITTSLRRCLSLCVLLGLMHALPVLAAPAEQSAREYFQPDQNSFSAVLLGDEWNHRFESSQGYTVARDDSGWWRYVSAYQGRTALLHTRRAHLSPPSGLAQHLAPATSQLTPSPYASKALSRGLNAASPVGNFDGQVLYILVDFTDIAGSTTESSWGDFIQNNIYDYYLSASYGKARLNPARETFGLSNNGVVGWINLPYAHPNPGNPGDSPGNFCASANAVNMQQMVREAVLAADAYVDFASYDSNADGELSSQELAVVIVTAGGESAVGDSPGVWGHAWSVFCVAKPVVDGVSVGGAGYAAFGELHRGNQASMGIMVHELGHLVFELPDLYDTDPSSTSAASSGIGAFGLMGHGSWGRTNSDNFAGQTPVLPSAWIKHSLGWVNATTLAANDAITAAGAAGANEANSTRILQSGNSGEYFLIENRQPQGYDRGLEDWLSVGFGGLAIWHIDENQPNNNDNNHRKVDLEAGDGSALGTSRGGRTDLWYAGNQITFDASSTPNSLRYDGQASGVAITAISAANTVMTLAILPPNIPPVAVNDSVSLNEDSALVTPNLLANDSDADGDFLSISAFQASSNAGGQVEQVGSGAFRYTPPANFHGSDGFSYQITDGEDQASAQVSITVNSVNDAPLAGADSANGVEDASAIDIAPLGNDTDIDGDSLSIVGFDASSTHGGSISQPAPGLLRYVPAANHNGADNFSYIVSDGNGGVDSAQVSLQLTAVNDAPSIVADSVSSDEDQPLLMGDPSANDSDIDGDSVSLISFDALSANGGQISSSANGLSYTPAANFNGVDRFGYRIGDGAGGTASGEVVITVRAVNDAPIAVIDSLDAIEDQAIAFDPLSNDTDIDADSLRLVSFDSSSLEGGTLVQLPSGALNYTPKANFSGPDRFAYRISDDQGGFADGEVQINVAARNDAPQAVADSLSTDEDTALDLLPLSNDLDVDGDALSIALFDASSSAGGSVARLSDSSLRYTPLAQFSGADSFSYTVSDGAGGESKASIEISVIAQNDAPLAVDDTLFAIEDTLATTGDVRANDSDVDGDHLSVQAFDAQSAQGGEVLLLGSGSFQYTPAAGFHGSDSFAYSIVDPSGAQASAQVSISVQSVNDAPQAGADVLLLDEDSPIDSANLLLNDSDPDGDALSVSAFDSRTDAGATVAHLGAGRFRYTPAANFHGSDQFSYRVTDGLGAQASAIVRVTVRPLNDAPSAVDDQAATAEERAVEIDVLGNDSDVDGEALAMVSFDAQSIAGAIIERLPDDRLRYRPPVGFAGDDSFSYQLRDAAGAQSSAVVRISVSPGLPLPAPGLSPGDSSSHLAIEVTISSSVAEASVHYTLDGSAPSRTHGTPIASGDSLQFTASGTLRVMAWLVGRRDSAIASASYVVDAQLDSDGDGMIDAWELEQGFDPQDPADAAQDGDGDGRSNLQEFQQGGDPNSDDVPPDLIAPADLQLDASGWWSAVELGEALAIDGADGTLSATRSSNGPYRPGAHRILWRASDAAGNRVEAEQLLSLRPLVSFGAAQRVPEGGEAVLPVLLNGDAPSYPVTLDYQISGSADASDHAARDGQLVIESGRSAELRFAVYADALDGEGEETVIVTLSAAEGAALGTQTEQTLTLVEGNLAPRVSWLLSQNGVPVASVGQLAGALLIDSRASDPNPGDTLSFDWSGSDNALLAQARIDDAQLWLDDPSLLAPGWYRIALQVSDNAAPAAGISAIVWLQIVTEQGAADADGDGVGDALDPLLATALLQLDGSALPQSYIATTPGLQLGLGEFARRADQLGAVLSLEQLTAQLGDAAMQSDQYRHDGELFSLRIDGLDQPGGSATLVLPLAQALADGQLLAVYVNGWQTLAEGAGEGVSSRSLSSCPQPGDAAFSPGMHNGSACLQLQLRDGGANDADGLANGSIELLLSVTREAAAAPADAVARGGGGALAVWLLLAGLLSLRIGSARRARRL